MPTPPTGVSWRAPTFAVAAEEEQPVARPLARGAVSSRAAVVRETVPVPPEHMVCHCGRHVPPDMMVDIRALSTSQRAAWGLTRAGDGLCDGCIDRVVRAGRVPLLDFFTALGAPAAWAQYIVDKYAWRGVTG